MDCSIPHASQEPTAEPAPGRNLRFDAPEPRPPRPVFVEPHDDRPQHPQS